MYKCIKSDHVAMTISKDLKNLIGELGTCIKSCDMLIFFSLERGLNNVGT